MEPCGFVRALRYGRPDSASRRQPIKKATRPPVADGPARPAVRQDHRVVGRNRDLVRQSRRCPDPSPPAPSSSSSSCRPWSSPATRPLSARRRPPSPSPSTAPSPSGAPSASAGSASPGRRARTRRAIYDAIEGQVVDAPRPPADQDGRARDHRRGRAQDDAHRGVRPSRPPPDVRGRERAAVQGARPAARGRRPARR